MTENRPSSPTDLDPEQLALLLEGKLSAREREALLARLAASPEELAVYADAVAATREPAELLERGAPGITAARRTPWRRRMPPMGWLAIAAGIVVLVAQPLVRGRDGSGVVAAHVSQLGRDAGTVERLALSPWSGVRSPTDVVPTPALPWRIGARFVDVEMAIASGDSAAAMRLGRQLAAMLEQAQVPAVTAGLYADSVALLGAGGADARRDAERDVVRRIGEQATLGVWVEAARYAILQQRSRFFAGDLTREATARLRQVDLLTPRAASLIEAAARGGATPEQWTQLEVELRELLALR
ncbi:MAG TPA: hypothetical protein VEA99_16235 [Gemmatimonadaceae bacterium]|nr:hypothetical protein [Gemmatimonadaceae bacterium]